MLLLATIDREKYAIKATVWYPNYARMSKADGKGMAGIAMAIPSFVKPDILLDLTVTMPSGLLYICMCDLIDPRSLVSTGRAWATSVVDIWLYMGLIMSRNNAPPEFKNLCACVKICLFLQLQ